MTETKDLSPQDALVAVMIAVSAADEEIRTAELVQMSNVINHLPVFAGYDAARLPIMSEFVFGHFEQEDGLEKLFARIREALPQRLWETAYALSCDTAAADGRIRETEARMLEEVRDELEIDRLHAAAIERGARARHMTL